MFSNPIEDFKQFYSRGFKEQLVTAFLSGIFVTAILSTYLISTFTSSKVEDKVESEGFQVTRDFADRNTLALLYFSEESARENIDAIKNFPDVKGVAIYDSSKKLLINDGAETFAEGIDEVENWPAAIELVAASKDAWYFAAPVFARGDDAVIAELPYIDEVQER